MLQRAFCSLELLLVTQTPPHSPRLVRAQLVRTMLTRRQAEAPPSVPPPHTVRWSCPGVGGPSPSAALRPGRPPAPLPAVCEGTHDSRPQPSGALPASAPAAQLQAKSGGQPAPPAPPATCLLPCPQRPAGAHVSAAAAAPPTPPTVCAPLAAVCSGGLQDAHPADGGRAVGAGAQEACARDSLEARAHQACAVGAPARQHVPKVSSAVSGGCWRGHGACSLAAAFRSCGAWWGWWVGVDHLGCGWRTTRIALCCVPRRHVCSAKDTCACGLEAPAADISCGTCACNL
jgi:hypothetical protein